MSKVYDEAYFKDEETEAPRGEDLQALAAQTGADVGFEGGH